MKPQEPMTCTTTKKSIIKRLPLNHSASHEQRL